MVTADAIVVGGGHNGLVAAAYLARAGLAVTVLERRPIVGGACVTEEIHPGFHVSTLAYACGLVRPEIKADLELARFGLEEHPFDPALFHPFPDRRFLLYRDDESWNRKQVARFSKADAAAWPRYARFWSLFRDRIEPTLLRSPPSEAELAALFHTPEARDVWDRVRTSSIALLLDEFFESDEVKASLVTGGVAGTFAGPHTPGTALVLGHHSLGDIAGVKGAWGWARGGMGAVSEAIARAARHFGATIRTEAAVHRILARDGTAVGVELEDAGRLDARVVLSNADPKRTFLGLLDEGHLPPEFRRAIERYRMEAASFKLNLALRELPDFEAQPGTQMQPHHRAIIALAPSIDYLDRAFAEAADGRPSSEPFLEIVAQSANDSTVAPAGMHTLSVSAKFAPFDLASGSWRDESARFTERILDVLEAYAPNIRRAIVAAHTTQQKAIS